MRRTAAAPFLAVLLLAGCAGGDPEPEETEPVETVAPDEPDATDDDTDLDTTDDLADDDAAGGVCDLLSFASLGAVFGAAMPEPEANDYGAGFSECIWDDGERKLRISVVPAANLQTDYFDQLNTQQMAGFDAGLGFPGMVGIGHVSGDGTTVGFVNGDDGILIGVYTAGASNDGTIAVEFAQEVLGG